MEKSAHFLLRDIDGKIKNDFAAHKKSTCLHGVILVFSSLPSHIPSLALMHFFRAGSEGGSPEQTSTDLPSVMPTPPSATAERIAAVADTLRRDSLESQDAFGKALNFTSPCEIHEDVQTYDSAGERGEMRQEQGSGSQVIGTLVDVGVVDSQGCDADPQDKLRDDFSSTPDTDILPHMHVQ